MLRFSIPLSVCALWPSTFFAENSDLVADYPMNRVVDNQLEDTSGNGNAARITGARAITSEVGLALQFRGDESVHCGGLPSLASADEVTIECWARVDAIPEAEVTIASKGSGGLGLNFYRDGCLWWYVTDGTSSLRTGLGLGVWTHLAGTYDGKITKLYVDGNEVGSRPWEGPLVVGGDFQIGTGLKGAVGSVRVHRRALSADEIQQIAARRQAQMGLSFRRVRNGLALPCKVPGTSIQIGDAGAIEVSVGEDAYVLETAMSFPGDVCGWHRLVATPNNDKDWKPAVRRDGNDIVARATGAHYQLDRRVSCEGHRITVTDTVTNISDADVAVMYEVALNSAGNFRERLLGGMDQPGVRMTSENPSVYVSAGDNGLGWLAEDDILRLQMDGATSVNSAKVSVRRFALKGGESYSFHWAIYPQSGASDYWDFVNQVRRDWKVNTTVEGPTEFWNVGSTLDLLRDHERLKRYLGRKKLKVIALMPWVDYDNYNAQTGRPTSREELKILLQEAKTAIQRVDSSIRCIGCIEANLVTPPEQLQRELYEASANKAQNQYPFTDEQMAMLKTHKLPWLDCLLTDRKGRCLYEVYYRGPEDAKIPMVAMGVYPAPNNSQHRFWLDQARWLLEDVGLDGLYIDQFNMAFDDSQRYSYDKWDGHTVDVDRDTGKILNRCTDAALVGIEPRRSLADYVIGRGGFMLANTFPEASRMQTAGVHRFNESEWRVDVRTWEDGDMPPLTSDPCKGHFSTPMALGFRPKLYGDWEPEHYAKIIHKGAIAYLRHGLLYSHYETEIPEEGPGSGEYGAINHMFPITPVELRPGKVIGKERIVTCVSGPYHWPHERRPELLTFDLEGRPCDAEAKFEKVESGWNVDLKLRDWAEVSVLE